MYKVFAFLLLTMALINSRHLFAHSNPHAKQVALVIGVDQYREVPALNASTSDAHDMALLLRKKGFRVTLVSNPGLALFNSTITKFIQSIDTDSTAIFYFSGHGIQIGGQNYMLPTDANVSDERSTRLSSYPLSSLLDLLAKQHAAANFVILDACQSALHGSHVLNSNQLTSASIPPNTFLALAASSGNEAFEDAGLGGGIFTQQLIHMWEQNNDLTAEKIFDEVHNRVIDLTNGHQSPSYVTNFPPSQRAIFPTSMQNSIGWFVEYSDSGVISFTPTQTPEHLSAPFSPPPDSDFRLSFNDLSVPVQSRATQVIRTYNTLNQEHLIGDGAEGYSSESTGVSQSGTLNLPNSDSKSNIIAFTYDANGNLLSKIDPIQGVVTYTHDSFGNITQIIDPVGGVTAFTYDANGNLLSTTDSVGRTVTYDYDPLGNLTRMTDPLGHVTVLSYDASGKVLTNMEPLSEEIFNYESALYQLDKKPTFTYARLPKSGLSTRFTSAVPSPTVSDFFVVQERGEKRVRCEITQSDFQTEQSNNGLVFRTPVPTFGVGAVEYMPLATVSLVSDIAGIFSIGLNDQSISRFGWKAQNKSFELFAGEAFNVEMGVTNELFLTEEPRRQGNSASPTDGTGASVCSPLISSQWSEASFYANQETSDAVPLYAHDQQNSIRLVNFTNSARNKPDELSLISLPFTKTSHPAFCRREGVGIPYYRNPSLNSNFVSGLDAIKQLQDSATLNQLQQPETHVEAPQRQCFQISSQPPTDSSGNDDRSSEIHLQIELALWLEIHDKNDPELFEDFLKKFPHGPFAVVAQKKWLSLKNMAISEVKAKTEQLDSISHVRLGASKGILPRSRGIGPLRQQSLSNRPHYVQPSAGSVIAQAGRRATESNELASSITNNTSGRFIYWLYFCILILIILISRVVRSHRFRAPWRDPQ